MKYQIVLMLGLLVTPSLSHATDWNQARSQLEMLQKVLEEKARAKQEGRKADMNRLRQEGNQILEDRQRRHNQQQAEQNRQAEQQRLARERAYKNSAQYKHNQKLMKAIKNDQTYGYGGKGAQPSRSNSSRYRPPQTTVPNYSQSSATASARRPSYAKPSYTKPRQTAKPSGITTNASRSSYQPTINYDADSLDASDIGLHDVSSSSNSHSTGGGYGAGVSGGKCLEWVETEPYECGIFGLDGSICTTRCIKHEFK